MNNYLVLLISKIIAFFSQIYQKQSYVWFYVEIKIKLSSFFICVLI